MVKVQKNCSLLFLGKKNCEHTIRAFNFCQQHFLKVDCFLGEWNEEMPGAIRQWSGEYIFSFLSRWVVPPSVLSKAKNAAINFHPASPDYPGIGCVNFALYEEADEYGVTCHHMTPNVDTGSIIAVKRFAVFANDNVATLLARTYDYQLALFYEVMELILKGKKIPVSSEKWSRKPFSRKDFNELSILKKSMSKEEIAKRVRATTFGQWKPTFEEE